MLVGQSVAALMAIACEMLISEMTIKAATKMRQENRKTIQHKDIASAIQMTHHFDFL